MSWGGASRAKLSADNKQQRWHFQHGPIDLILGIVGPAHAIEKAIECAWCRFATVLPELVDELALLRQGLPLNLPANLASGELPLKGKVARRMYQACLPFAGVDQLFVTPMAAVAGSVAEEILTHLKVPQVHKAWVNNGGDIAWFAPLDSKQTFSVGIANPQAFDCSMDEAGAHLPSQDAGQLLSDRIVLSPDDHCWGIATSGWRGRSLSLGIADAVTVLASAAADADVAATLVANAVSLVAVAPNHPAILRQPGSMVRDDSDLGDRLVTVDVGVLTEAEIRLALDFGEAYAKTLLSRGQIKAAVLCLGNQRRVCRPSGESMAAMLGKPPSTPALLAR
jgi:uncharacterized protein